MSRPQAQYHSAWPYWNAKPPAWPAADGKRVFAYLKSFPTLANVLGILAETRMPTIVIADGIDRPMQRQFARPWLVFENEPVDLVQAMQQCDVAVCNGNHGTTIALLQAGKPALYLPLHLEHTLTSYAVQRAGAGLMATVRRPEQIALRFASVLHDPSIGAAAQRARSWFGDYNQSRSLDEILSRFEGAIAARTSS
jgi:UDP:flavonoid glycosyltransferase YjiC (YdhE family)